MSSDIDYRLSLIKNARDHLKTDKPHIRNYSAVERTSFLISLPENESEPEHLSSCNSSIFADKPKDLSKNDNNLHPFGNNNANIHHHIIANDQIRDLIDAEDV